MSTILLLGKETLGRADFATIYGTHIGLALLTGLLCSAIQTRPAVAAPSAPSPVATRTL